ncbi:CPBP family intramembrane glutamic endopeptidase [Streptomyces sparsogenes]|uniref:Abortive infection protein n=1 Tax=Streptomyces sparsogenes DSM 40356 TaxID=1331668 RepID=A0A1R1SIV7_9ACTN|nr:CPBP family intramembrane glutamic endopeptidase [Streptomyces sparsogenes]OMI38203.1 Abortive infection protein [Streptomyces sparsogenes DSM 40356]
MRHKWKAKAGLFLAVTFVAAGALGAAQPATGIPDEVIQLTQFGPALGVAAVALLWPGGVRALLAGALPGRAADATADSPAYGPGPAPYGAGRALPLLATALLITALSAGAYALATGDAHATDPRTLDHPFALIVVAQLVGACGEEIGWRCFFQPLLRTRFGPLAASAAVGVVWGVWHVQVFVQAPAYAAGFLLATVAMSVVLGLGLERVRANRLLLAGGFHTLINLGMLLFMDEESGAVLPMVLFGAACLVAAVPWVRRAPAATIPAVAPSGR